MRAKKFFSEMLLCILCGLFFGVLGLVFGWGESRTGRYSGIEPFGCWFVALGLGIYAWYWMRQPQSNRKVGRWHGLLRAIVALLSFSWMATFATGMKDLTVDPSLYNSAVPLWEAAAGVYGFCLLGCLVSAIVAGIIAIFRGLRRLLTNRATV
jgi:drug/metabolite transporter (DMT)-like permease